MATVASLVAGLGLTVLGLGAADQAVASYDAASWVWSRAKGEMARINGVTARVDTRVDVPGARAHQVQVSQTDRFVILRDVTTGEVSSMDLTSLQVGEPSPTTVGLGVSVALQDDAAFIIDKVQGIVRQIDPRTLTPIGEPLRYPPGITGGVFDGAGRLWIAVPGEGTVSAITPAPLASEAPAAGAAGGAGPRLVRTEPVAPASHELTISTLDTGVAVLNRTTNELTTIRGEDDPSTVILPLAGPGSLPPRTDGATVPVTVPDDRHVYVVGADGVRDFEVPGDGAELQPAVAWEGYYYVADADAGTVHVFDGDGRPSDDIAIRNGNGRLELEVREDHLFINAPNGSTARVVDDKHRVRVVDKYADDVLGGDPPPTPPAPPPPPKPRKPVVSKPGAPRNVRAAAGNAEARVTWRPAAANGAAITRYVVEGAGKTFQVGANQRGLNVTGLTNGETYSFAVHAVNAKGAGPARTSNSVRPTSEVPDAPASVSAEARPDGTVAVTWPEANGQGLEIKRYAVTAISDGTTAPIGEATGTELVVDDGDLEYGRQYAFTVRGAGSKASPASDSVVPFTRPGRPDPVDASTVGGQKGAIQVTWAPAADNGRPVTKYVVTADGRSTDVTAGTSATLTGFGDGANVSVEVRAVNEAGDGEPGTATATTVAPPTVTVTGSSATTTTATVTFTVNAGGGTATCTMTGGGGKASGSCSSLRITKLDPGKSYSFTVTATNAAGSGTAKRTQATDAVYGIATCKNGKEGDTATYCSKERPNARNGNEIFKVTQQDDDRQAGWVPNGTRLKAYCKKTGGEEVYAYIYNNDKRSTTWIQVEYEGKNYIPWAWLNLEGGDDLSILPNC
jgi:hypothetical protein